jgi:hypothetical protein
MPPAKREEMPRGELYIPLLKCQMPPPTAPMPNAPPTSSRMRSGHGSRLARCGARRASAGAQQRRGAALGRPAAKQRQRGSCRTRGPRCRSWRRARGRVTSARRNSWPAAAAAAASLAALCGLFGLAAQTARRAAHGSRCVAAGGRARTAAAGERRDALLSSGVGGGVCKFGELEAPRAAASSSERPRGA